VSFIGTKQRRDIMTNANIMQETLWPELAEVPIGDTQVSFTQPYVQHLSEPHLRFTSLNLGSEIHSLLDDTLYDSLH